MAQLRPLHRWRPDCSIGHISLPGAEQGGVRIETADRRYEVRTLDDGIVYIREPHILPFCRCNIRFVHGRLCSPPVDNRHRRAPCAVSACRRTGIGPGARGRAGRSGRRSPRAWRARVASRQMTMRPNAVRCREQPGTWVTVLTGDMGNMFQFLFMLH